MHEQAVEQFPNIVASAIVVQIVGFIALYMLLSKFFFGPIAGILAERAKVEREKLAEAERNRSEMIALRVDYEKRLAGIEGEARERIQMATREAHQARDELLAQAREKAETIVTKAHAEVDREREQAMVSLRDTVADLAITAAEKVIEKNLDAAAHRRLIDDILNEVKHG